MIHYLDSSALLRFLFRHSGYININSLEGSFVTSELTNLECRRTLIRYRLNSEVDDQGLVHLYEDLSELFSYIDILALNSSILTEASQNWGVTLGSLDSIHLASAIFYKKQKKEPFTLVTHDKSLSIASRLTGLYVMGVG